MKLLHHITRKYLLVMLIALALCGITLYFTLKELVMDEMIEQLDLQAEMIASELRKGQEVNFPLASYTQVDGSDTERVVKDTLLHDPLQQVDEDYALLSVVKNINQSFYRINVMTTFIGWQKYYTTIFYLLLFAALVIAVSGIIFNYFLSRKIWRPFFQNLKALQTYSLNDPELILKDSPIAEFKEMQTALDTMTRRSRKEYLALREFTENASHEIQTPLSIVRAKLDRISQFPVTEELAECIVQAKAGLERMSRVSKDLLLLAKIDNQTFTENTSHSLHEAIRENILQMEELFHARNIPLSLHLNNDQQLFCNEQLLNTLLSNLLSNALLYTPEGGSITIASHHNGCTISNTGAPLHFPEQLIFNRFKKGDPQSQSTGLGLSIVSQICQLYHWNIHYRYAQQQHVFELLFL